VAEEAKPLNVSEALISKKLLTQDQVFKVAKVQQEKSRTVLEAVNEMGLISAENLYQFVGLDLDFPFIRLTRCRIRPDVISSIPKRLVYSYQSVPISKINDILTVAMSDPTNKNACEDIQKVTGLQVVAVFALTKEIVDVLDSVYSEEETDKLQDFMRDMEIEMTLVDEKKGDAQESVSELVNLTQEEPVVKLTDHILNEGVRRRASDIFVEPQEKELVIRYRVDGVLQEGPRPPRSMHRGIISRIKIMTNLDIAEHRLPQDGRLKLKIQSRMVDFRVSTIPTYLGEKACLRILDGSSAKLDLKNLGFDDKSHNDLMTAGTRPYGMILTCGPTGSGKTTTLYSILNAINSIERNLVTIEDPVEYAIAGLNQVNVRADVGLTFAAALRSILRQDPDVILVGEIRDNETADVAVKSALTGHLVLSTLHTNSAVGCVVRLANMGVEPFLLASSMVLAASQRLIRKLCPDCKEEYEPSAEMRKHLGTGDEAIKYFRPKGCTRCNASGYSGRSCVIETLAITPQLRELITRRATEKEIKELAREQGMVTLRENSLNKMRAGQTSPEEVLRVSAEDES